MVRQTPLGRGTQHNGAAEFGRNFSLLAQDFATLAELQLRLFAVDLREARRSAIPALAAIVAGAVLALGCLPVLMAAAAYSLVEFAQWPASGSFGLVGGAALLIASLSAFVGWKRLSSAASTLSRSREELSETLHWLKRALHTSPSGERHRVG